MATKRPNLTSEAGVPVADNHHSETAGPAGPTRLHLYVAR
jgi:catalase